MISDLKPYKEYKESGLPWLGYIPDHWVIERGKRLFSKMDRPVRQEDEVVTCFRDGVVTLRKNRRLRGFTEATFFSGYQGVRKGDLVIHGMDAFAGAIGVSDSDGKGTPVYNVCQPRRGVSADYYAHLIRQMAQSQWILALAKGIRERSTDFRFEMFGSQRVPLPPPDEQAAIVRFLDWANGRLERAIRAKRKVIALLNEQKQAIIHQAVTRGLDPNVPLKPSGIPWLGEIPGHWEVHQLRRLVKPGQRITYGIVQPGEPDPHGRFMIRGQDYSTGWAQPSSIFRVSAEVETPYSRSRLSAGDLVVTIVGAGVGNVAIVPEWLDGANITQTTARISVNPLMANPNYVALVLQGPIGKRNVERYVKGAAQPGLNLEHVRIFLVPSPPLYEQSHIVDSTKRELETFASADVRLQREIELLREYRTRLVADVVTGKLDVREAAGRLPDEDGLELSDDDIELDDETETVDEEAVL